MNRRDIPIRIKEGVVKLNPLDPTPKYLENVIDNLTIKINPITGKLYATQSASDDESFPWNSVETIFNNNIETYIFKNNNEVTCEIIIENSHSNNVTNIINKITINNFYRNIKITYNINYDSDYLFTEITRSQEEI